MTYVAIRMLVHDSAKYLGLVFAIGFAAFLISHQASIFTSIMGRTSSQIKDVSDASVWIMDPQTQSFDENKPMSDNELMRVRSITGVSWATRLFKNNVRIKTSSGLYRVGILLGVDDVTLVGAPRKYLLGDAQALREADSIVLDLAGYTYLFPGEELALGREVEINDRRAKIAGICESSAPFQTLPVLFARYSEAVTFVGRERNQMSFILAEPTAQISDQAIAERITQRTGLKAMTSDDFAWMTVWYYIQNTGIPINFGITVCVGIIVGTVVSGQTFYIFTQENLRQFAALKAIGVGNLRIVQMVLTQAVMVGLIGYGLGLAMCASFFLITKDIPALRGFILRWEIMVGVAVLVIGIVMVASLLSLVRLVRLEPAVVFRS